MTNKRIQVTRYRSNLILRVGERKMIKTDEANERFQNMLKTYNNCKNEDTERRLSLAFEELEHAMTEDGIKLNHLSRNRPSESK